MKAKTARLLAAIVWAMLPGVGWAQQAEPEGGLLTRKGHEAALAQKRPVPQAPATPAKPAKPSRPSGAAVRRESGRPGSFEMSGGAQFLAPASLGSSTASLTSNASSTRFTYFEGSARAGGAPGLEARLTYNLTRRFAVEGGLLYSKPKVNFTISGDAEEAAGFTGSGEGLSQYFVDGNLVVFLPTLAFAGGRGRTFIEGGGGYLRQLHEGRFNIDTGSVYNGGAGFKYYFRPRAKGLMKGFGVRVDLRAYYKRGGFSFDGRNTWTAALGGGGIIAF